MKDLAGHIAVVTGGTRGIGRAIAEQLLDAGATVALCGKTEATAQKAARELAGRGKVIARACDVADPGQVADLFRFVDENAGRCTILVNNAGLGIFRPTAELTVDDWKTVVETNLSGAFYCSRQALERMKSRKSGYIINISSLAGKNPFAAGAAYNASKFGMNGFSEAMMLDHRHDGVRVSYIMPGSVATEFSSGGGGDWKIAASDIADIVMMLLRTPQRTLISRVEVRPSRPGK